MRLSSVSLHSSFGHFISFYEKRFACPLAFGLDVAFQIDYSIKEASVTLIMHPMKKYVTILEDIFYFSRD